MIGLQKWVVSLLIFSLLVCAENAFADTDKLIVSLGLKEEFNDNVVFTTGDELDDFITTLSPGVKLQRKDERTSASIGGVFDIAMYSDHSSLDNVDQLYEADLDHFLTPKLSVSGNVSYKRDSRPDRDIEETGLVLGTDTRKVQRYNAGFDYTLTEKASISMDYGHKRDDFDAASKTDSDSHNVNMSVSYNLGDWFPLTYGRFSTGYSQHNYPSTSTDNYSVTVGLERRMSEIYSFYADLGARFTEPQNGKNNSGEVVRCGLKYHGELTFGNAYLNHEMLPTSGESGLKERTSFVMSVNRRFAEFVVGSFNGGYYVNKSSNTDKHTFRVNPKLQYRFAEHMKLETGYTFTQVKNKKQNDQTKERSIIAVSLVIDQPFFE